MSGPVHGDARPIGEMAPLALLQAESGAAVAHPQAPRRALVRRVPLRVHGFRAPLSGRGGTVVHEGPVREAAA
ncbi:MAG TPA: hypothetical protein VF142_07285 [Longimicrobium sp.]